jgi:hypothetical protein
MEGGATALYLHSLSTDSGQILDKTQGGTSPYWSTDGRWILFSAAGELKMLDLTRGSIRVIAQESSTAGVQRGPSGFILLGDFGGPIRAASSPTDGLRPVTRLNRSRREVAHMFPRLLPDGEHFNHLARSEVPSESAVYV